MGGWRGVFRGAHASGSSDGPSAGRCILSDHDAHADSGSYRPEQELADVVLPKLTQQSQRVTDFSTSILPVPRRRESATAQLRGD
jgi:hypothetical protein